MPHATRLDAEQEQTLITIVEVVRQAPRSERHSFILAETNQYAAIVMPGARAQPHVLASDVRELLYAGLLRLAPGGSRAVIADAEPRRCSLTQHSMPVM